jgi:hypothetical protein
MTTHRGSLPECSRKLNTRSRATSSRSQRRWKPRQHFDLTILQKEEEKGLKDKETLDAQSDETDSTNALDTHGGL